MQRNGSDDARWHPELAVAAGLLLLILAMTLAGASDAAWAQAPVPAPGWGVMQLMNGMRGVRHATARFVEQKFMQMLRQPQESSGRLIYVAPDRLQKETLAPTPSELIVNGD